MLLNIGGIRQRALSPAFHARSGGYKLIELFKAAIHRKRAVQWGAAPRRPKIRTPCARPSARSSADGSAAGPPPDLIRGAAPAPRIGVGDWPAMGPAAPVDHRGFALRDCGRPPTAPRQPPHRSCQGRRHRGGAVRASTAEIQTIAQSLKRPSVIVDHPTNEEFAPSFTV